MPFPLKFTTTYDLKVTYAANSSSSKHLKKTRSSYSKEKYYDRRLGKVHAKYDKNFQVSLRTV